MRSRSLIVVILLAASVLPAFAVRVDTLHTTFVANSVYIPTHTLQVSLGGGMHALMPQLTREGQDMIGLRKSLGAGGQVQALYTFYFHKYVGFTAGLGFEMYSGSMSGAFKDSATLWDNTNELQYTLYTDYHDFKESQQLYLLDMPVGVTGRVSLTDHLSLRGTLGFGMNIVVGSHFRAKGELTTTAYYPAYNLYFDPDLPQHGFSNYYLGGYNGKFGNTFPVNMYVFGDFGAHYQFTKRWGIYAGVYIQYTCFNAVREQQDLTGNRYQLVNFNLQDQQWYYRGMVNTKFVEALHPLSVGVKVGVTITYLDRAKCNCEDI